MLVYYKNISLENVHQKLLLNKTSPSSRFSLTNQTNTRCIIPAKTSIIPTANTVDCIGFPHPVFETKANMQANMHRQLITML